MNNAFIKIKQSKVIDIVKNILSSKYFPFFTAALFLLCYYTGLDLLAIYYLATVVILILLLLEDITPVIPQLLFINLVVSLKNAPSPVMGGSDFYTRTEVLVQAGIMFSLAVAALIYRIVYCCVKKKFKTSPIFFGLSVFCFTLLLNGLLNENYSIKNFLFGLMLALCFLGIYILIKNNITANNDCFEKVAYGFIALSALLIVQLVVAYATTEDLFINGTINRSALVFGWGVYNTYGLMILICLPAATFLAGREKHGYIFTVYSAFIFTATILSCSRQSMLGAMFIYPVCLIILLVKGKYRIPNLCITAAIAVTGAVLIGVFHREIAEALKTIFENIIVDGELNGSGRWRLWKEALTYFSEYPLFGAGFYVERSYDAFELLGLVPLMCHNTILQLMSSCGIVGLVAYCIHRVQTVTCYCKNITVERTFIALTIAIILLLSLIDMHIFNIFPTIIYSCLLAVLEKSERSV